MQANFVRGLAAATKFDQAGYSSTKIMNIEQGPPKEYGQDRKPENKRARGLAPLAIPPHSGLHTAGLPGQDIPCSTVGHCAR